MHSVLLATCSLMICTQLLEDVLCFVTHLLTKEKEKHAFRIALGGGMTDDRYVGSQRV